MRWRRGRGAGGRTVPFSVHIMWENVGFQFSEGLLNDVSDISLPSHFLATECVPGFHCASENLERPISQCSVVTPRRVNRGHFHPTVS